METLETKIQQINRELEAITQFLADICSIIPVKMLKVTTIQVKRIALEIAFSLGIYKGK